MIMLCSSKCERGDLGVTKTDRELGAGNFDEVSRRLAPGQNSSHDPVTTMGLA